jgi:hypothetical protein
LKPGDIFVTRSKTPYELDWKSPVGEELDFIIIHLAVDHFLTREAPRAMPDIPPTSEWFRRTTIDTAEVYGPFLNEELVGDRRAKLRLSRG